MRTSDKMTELNYFKQFETDDKEEIIINETKPEQETEIKNNEKNNPFLKNQDIAVFLQNQIKVNANFTLRTLLLIRLLQKSILSVKHILSLIKFIK